MTTTVLLVAVLLSAAEPRLLRPHVIVTPGVLITPLVPVAAVCTPGYAKTVRYVTRGTKRAVFARYRITPSRAFEIDHLVPLELGGSNDIGNLWPQSYRTAPMNARTKDALENRLHWLVCHRGLLLADAQRAIVTDWIDAYQHFVVANAVR
jgi:hypothetical protein